MKAEEVVVVEEIQVVVAEVVANRSCSYRALTVDVTLGEVTVAAAAAVVVAARVLMLLLKIG